MSQVVIDEVVPGDQEVMVEARSELLDQRGMQAEEDMDSESNGQTAFVFFIALGRRTRT